MYYTPCTLDTELYAECTSGETAEAVGEDPEWDECADEENEDAKEGEKLNLSGFEGEGPGGQTRTYTMVRRRPICWLIVPAIAPPLQR